MRRLVGLVFVAVCAPLVACGGASEESPDEAMTGGTGGSAGSSLGGTGGSAGTGVGGSAGVAGTGGTPWPDRAAEPTRCSPGGPGATLPSESFTCTVHDRLGSSDVFWIWDATTRTLTEQGDRGDGTMWGLYWVYSTDGRVSRYGEPNGFDFDSYYDEHGVVVRVTSDRYPEMFTEPEYDESARLIRETRLENEQLPSLLSYAYGYDEVERLSSTELNVGADNVVESRTSLTYHRDCSLDLLEQQGSYHGWANGTVIVRNRHFYDDAERLIRRESDGGGFFDTPADGVTDEFDRWTYAADGSVASFERDGTADDVGGPADGTPDESYTFSPECMKLVTFRRDLFRFPN